MPRPLHEIAREIQTNWKTVDYAAKPYLAAMSDLESLNDQYGSDDGRNIVNYFLVNASKWRGDVAKRVKAELNQMLKKRASDRSSLIRLASTLPAGSAERKAILAGLWKVGGSVTLPPQFDHMKVHPTLKKILEQTADSWYHDGSYTGLAGALQEALNTAVSGAEREDPYRHGSPKEWLAEAARRAEGSAVGKKPFNPALANAWLLYGFQLIRQNSVWSRA